MLKFKLFPLIISNSKVTLSLLQRRAMALNCAVATSGRS